MSLRNIAVKGASRVPLTTQREVVRGRAPLRISFCGGGTDVPPYPETHGGCVLSCTIDKYAYVSLRPRANDTVRIESRDLKRVLEFSNGERPNEPGLAESLIQRFNEKSLDCYMHSDAPPGSGLGSSSAMIVALIGALALKNGVRLSAYEIANLAVAIEREDLQIAGGLQDQYAATFGGFNFIEFAKGEIIVHPLRIAQDTLDELNYNLLLCYTGNTRSSSRIIREQTNSVISESQQVMNGLAELKRLTIELKRALLTDNCSEFGDLLNEAWNLKKRLASGITTPHIDTLYDEALKAGAIGGKLLGAGGGGYLLLFVPFTARERVTERVERAGGQIVSFRFESQGARSWAVPSTMWS